MGSATALLQRHEVGTDEQARAGFGCDPTICGMYGDDPCFMPMCMGCPQCTTHPPAWAMGSMSGMGSMMGPPPPPPPPPTGSMSGMGSMMAPPPTGSMGSMSGMGSM